MDGVNCMTFERCHPDFYRDTEKYDHKLNGCGLNYDIGMHLFQDGLIWINGPYKSGANNDRGDFVEHVLRDKLKYIGDKEAQIKLAYLMTLVMTQLQILKHSPK